jgi:hypothetical protein
MSIELKIKSKHLALEPEIIRKEERKLRKQIKHLKAYHQVNDDYSDVIYPLHTKWAHLANHRKWNVRNEARATYLARAYIKGVPYATVEQTSDKYKLRDYILPRVLDMVARYGPNKIHKYYLPNGTRDYKKEEREKLLTEIKNWCNIE